MKQTATPQATACILSQTAAQTVWLVEVPGLGGSKLYRATTYPGSNLLFVQGESGRVISAGPAARLIPILREAIERAKIDVEQARTKPT